MIVVLRDNSSTLADEMRVILSDPSRRTIHPRLSVFPLDVNESSRIKEADLPKGLPHILLFKYVSQVCLN